MPVEPWMIDLILAGIAVEFVAGAYLFRRSGRPHLIAPFGWFLVSGGALMMAVRMALTGVAGPALAAAMLVSLVTHILSLLGIYRIVRPSAQP